MNDLLNIRGLSKHYGEFSLESIDLAVPAGSVVGLIGSNGAGKTTTIKATLGLIEPDGGSVELFGQTVGGRMPAQRMADAKQRVGVVFDTCAFPEELTVGTVGTLMRACYSWWDEEMFASMTSAHGLAASKTVKELSRGMGMKLSLICALAHNPDLLLLDEATAGLDPMAREEVLDILRSFMNESRGILLSSHITSDLDKIADYIVCIDQGRIAFSIEKDAICDMAGIAHCRAAEFDEVVASGFFEPGQMRFVRQPYGTDVLVPDRYAFAESFGNIAVDKADIELYMSLMLKGGIQ